MAYEGGIGALLAFVSFSLHMARLGPLKIPRCFVLLVFLFPYLHFHTIKGIVRPHQRR